MKSDEIPSLKCKMLYFIGFMVLVMKEECLASPDVKCDVNCKCSNGIMSCKKYMPNILSDDIDSLTIVGNADEKHTFWTDGSWKRLKSLTLQNLTSFGFGDVYEFKNLNNLEYFGLHSSHFFQLEKEHLSSMENLKCLNLSRTYNLRFTTLISALQGSTLPNLEVLDLDYVSSTYERTTVNVIGKSFYDALHGKPIKRLVITNTLLLLEPASCLVFSLPSLEFLNISGPWISKISGRKLADICKNTRLQTIDLSVSAIYVFKTGRDLVLSGNYTANHGFKPFTLCLMGIKNVYLNDIFAMNISITETINITRYLPARDFDFATKSLHLRRNGLKKLDIRILHFPHIGLTVLDLAENILEFISPEFFKPFGNLSHLDLSFNRFYKMELDPLFQKLFVHLKSLKVLKLSSNQLSFLPEDIFKHNENLVDIDLSNNKLFHVVFTVRHLKSLNVLNFADNNVKFLEKGFIDQLDDLDFYPIFSKFHDENNMNVIILSNNILHCSCDSVAFLNWLLLRFNNTDAEQPATCYLEGTVTKIDKEVVAQSKYLCIKKIITAVVCIVGVILVLVAACILLACYFRHRRHVKLKIMKCLLDDLSRKLVQKYLIYLSYAEDDVDLVLNDIYPQLARELRALVGYDENLICEGAYTIRLGYRIQEEMIKYISESCIVVCVLSNEFCSSRSCNAEVQEAESQDRPLFLFQLDGVDERLMSPYFRSVARRHTKVRLSILDGHSVFTPNLHTVLKLLLEKAVAKHRCVD